MKTVVPRIKHTTTELSMPQKLKQDSVKKNTSNVTLEYSSRKRDDDSYDSKRQKLSRSDKEDSEKRRRDNSSVRASETNKVPVQSSQASNVETIVVSNQPPQFKVFTDEEDSDDDREEDVVAVLKNKLQGLQNDIIELTTARVGKERKFKRHLHKMVDQIQRQIEADFENDKKTAEILKQEVDKL